MTFLSAPRVGQAALFALAGGLAAFACSSPAPTDDLPEKPSTRPVDDDPADDDGTSSGALPAPVDAGKLQLIRISAGRTHTCVLWNDGVMKCWGGNDRGQLGLGDLASRGDAPGAMGKKLPPVSLGNGVRSQTVAAGGDRTCAILSDGRVKCFGWNVFGGLGQPDDLDRGDTPETSGDGIAPVDLGAGVVAKDLGQGDFATCALLGDGTVKCWGSNVGGELGYGDELQRGGQPGAGVAALGNDLPPVDVGLSGIASVRLTSATQVQTGCALTGGGQMKCWGGNDHGQLGLGDTEARGDDNDEMGGQLPLVKSGGSVTFMALGHEALCVGLDTGQMRCWGNGEFGKLGQGDTDAEGTDAGINLPLVNLGTSSKAVSASMYNHVCTIFEDRSLKCWGNNASGQLGLGDTQNRGDQPNQMGTKLPAVDYGSDTPLEVAAGADHTCVRFASQKVKCWGGNDFGQLGYGDTAARGATPGSMGTTLPYLDLGR